MALAAVLRSVRGRRRKAFLIAHDVRAWLAQAEEAVSLAFPPRTDRALFDRVAAGSHLAEAAPAGRLDRGFRRRAVAIGRRLRARAFLALPPLLIHRTPPGARFGPFPLDLDADGEMHLSFPIPVTLRFRAAGRRTPRPSLTLAGGGASFDLRGATLAIEERPTIPGTGIVVARRAVSTRAGLRPGPPVPDLPDRLGRALDLLRAAWPEGHDEVLAHTRVVVPLVERGTVSFSLPSRPGVSYINVEGKTLVDLADDLLHETAHHRLHGLEELGPLTRDDGEPRYVSPWRRSLRPLRGILHATYTFAWRAELLERLTRLSPARAGRLPRRKIARELAFERKALARSEEHLREAAAEGLLASGGERLLAAISRSRGG